MAKQPFTPDGVQAKVAELYALPDNELFDHADDVRNNFKGWMNANFDLSADQQAYMNTLNEDWIDLASCQLKISFKTKQPIYLAPVFGGGEWASKLAGSHYDMDCTSKEALLAGTGELTFYFKYD